jgi:hypothetical protein
MSMQGRIDKTRSSTGHWNERIKKQAVSMQGRIDKTRSSTGHWNERKWHSKTNNWFLEILLWNQLQASKIFFGVLPSHFVREQMGYRRQFYYLSNIRYYSPIKQHRIYWGNITILQKDLIEIKLPYISYFTTHTSKLMKNTAFDGELR